MKYSSKAFLNQDGFNSDASIFTEFYFYDHHSPHSTGNTAEVAIRDCQQRVSLDFDFIDEKTFNNSIYKLNTMIEQLKDFKEVLGEAYKEFLRREGIIENEQKAEKQDIKAE